MSNLNLNTKSVLLRPRITEKAVLGADRAGVYVFEVSQDATKKAIRAEVEAFYKVVPVKVRTVTLKSRNVFVRGKKGKTKRGKKAYVYLKKGEKIELI